MAVSKQEVDMDTEITASALERIDWNEEWKKAQLRASYRKRRSDSTGFWNLKAKRYDHMENKGNERAEQAIDRMGIDGNTSVIDIGCGPGTVSIPLARVAGIVTAVDPASGMIASLQEKASAEGLSNIRTINKRWEDVLIGTDLENHDVVVASYSLAMDDISSALEKMVDVSKTGVCLFWFAGKHSWGRALLWSKLFGESYVAGPDHIYLLNVLHQMDIHPNVEVTRRTHVQRFHSFDDAVQQWRENFPELTPDQDEIIREHVRSALQQEDGTFSSRTHIVTAMIWWKKETG
jgi:ubiquinone/menaquinone biosynthesis C-methylase UbiE